MELSYNGAKLHSADLEGGSLNSCSFGAVSIGVYSVEDNLSFTNEKLSGIVYT